MRQISLAVKYRGNPTKRREFAIFPLRHQTVPRLVSVSVHSFNLEPELRLCVANQSAVLDATVQNCSCRLVPNLGSNPICLVLQSNTEIQSAINK